MTKPTMMDVQDPTTIATKENEMYNCNETYAVRCNAGSVPNTISFTGKTPEQTKQSNKAFDNYIQQKQAQQQQHVSNLDELLKSCDLLLAAEKETPKLIIKPPKTATEKARILLQKQQQNARTLSSVNLLRTMQKTENPESGETNFIMVPLAEQSKFRDQWIRQASDTLNLEQRERLKVLLTKSTKTRMKQQARLFCRTNQPIEDIQRGSLCYIYHEILKYFNPMSQQLISLGPMKCISTIVLLTNVVPLELLKKVFDHLFVVQSENRKNAPPNSKKKVSTIDELMQTKESGRVFQLINDWLWQHMPGQSMADKIIASGNELPLCNYVNRLKTCRAEIVLIMKALEENQCRNEAVDSFQKMVLHVQTLNESINTQLQTQSARSKMSDNIALVNKMNLNLSSGSRTSLVAYNKQQHNLKRKQQQQQQHQQIKRTKIIEALPNPPSSKKSSSATQQQQQTAVDFKFTMPTKVAPAATFKEPQLPKQQRKRKITNNTTVIGGKNVIAFKEQVALQHKKK